MFNVDLSGIIGRFLTVGIKMGINGLQIPREFASLLLLVAKVVATVLARRLRFFLYKKVNILIFNYFFKYLCPRLFFVPLFFLFS